MGLRAEAISDCVMGMKGRVGRGSGSSHWKGATSGRSAMKKCTDKASLISEWSCEMTELAVRSGGIRLMERPFLQAAASQRFSEVV